MVSQVQRRRMQGMGLAATALVPAVPFVIGTGGVARAPERAAPERVVKDEGARSAPPVAAAAAAAVAAAGALRVILPRRGGRKKTRALPAAGGVRRGSRGW